MTTITNLTVKTLHKYKIIIDERERLVYKHLDELTNHHHMFYVNTEIKTLSVGDYLVYHYNTPIAIIERKTWDDLRSSIRDGRHSNHNDLVNLRERYGSSFKIIYLIEGCNTRIARSTYPECVTYLDKRMWVDNILVLYSSSPLDTLIRIGEFIIHCDPCIECNERIERIERIECIECIERIESNTHQHADMNTETDMKLDMDTQPNMNPTLNPDTTSDIIKTHDILSVMKSVKKSSEPSSQYLIWVCLDGIGASSARKLCSTCTLASFYNIDYPSIERLAKDTSIPTKRLQQAHRHLIDDTRNNILLKSIKGIGESLVQSMKAVNLIESICKHEKLPEQCSKSKLLNKVFQAFHTTE